jgi:D-alanyl-D-alanine dipeptidase
MNRTLLGKAIATQDDRMIRFARLCVAGAVVALLGACASPPHAIRDASSPAAQALVNLRSPASGIRFDIRYATKRNFTGRQLYPSPQAWLRYDAAAALRRVERDLAEQGLGLKVYDAYRPLHVQWIMWNLIHDERYVSNPGKNAGRHTRGTAVDVSLVDSRGSELPMPTAFDDFTERAHRDAAGIPPQARRNSLILEHAMVRRGFIPYPFEWWHFDYRGWEKQPPLDVPLEELGRKR